MGHISGYLIQPDKSRFLFRLADGSGNDMGYIVRIVSQRRIKPWERGDWISSTEYFVRAYRQDGIGPVYVGRGYGVNMSISLRESKMTHSQAYGS